MSLSMGIDFLIKAYLFRNLYLMHGAQAQSSTKNPLPWIGLSESDSKLYTEFTFVKEKITNT
jgi:hypothetical protein